MKRLLFFFVAFASGMVHSQNMPVNRYNELFLGDLIVDQPFYVGDMILERNKLGKRQLLQNNLLGIGGLSLYKFTNGNSFANPGLMSYPKIRNKTIEMNKTGNGLTGVDFSLGFRDKNSVKLSFLSQNDFSMNRIRGNHLSAYADYQFRINPYRNPMFIYASFLANYKDQTVGYGLADAELTERRLGSLKTQRDLYANSGLVTANHIGLVRHLTYNGSRNILIFNHKNTIALNRTFLNGTRQYLDRQITDISTVRFNLDEGFARIKLGAEYMYRYTLETDSVTVLTNQKVNDWAVFGSIEQSFSKTSSLTLGIRADYAHQNGAYLQPKIEYNLRKSLSFNVKAYRFVNDDISVTEYIRPYLQGNRKLLMNAQNRIEKGNALMISTSKYSGRTTFNVTFALRDYAVKKVLSMNEQTNTLSMSNVRDLEYFAFVGFDSRLLTKKKLEINSRNSYKFQTFANAANGLNIAKHSLYNELSFLIGNRFVNYVVTSNAIRISIAHTSRFGIDDYFQIQANKGNQLGICDAKLSVGGYYVTQFLRAIQVMKKDQYSKKSRFFDQFKIELSVYDVFSKQVRGNFNQGVQGFSGTSVPLMNYRYGASLIYSFR